MSISKIITRNDALAFGCLATATSNLYACRMSEGRYGNSQHPLEEYRILASAVNTTSLFAEATTQLAGARSGFWR